MDAFQRPLFPGDGDSVYDDACSGRAFAPWRCRFGTRRLPITRSSCGLLSEHVPLLRRNGPQYFAYADFDGYRALIIKHEQCVSAFRSLCSCFPRVPADSPLHSDAMGAVK